MTTNLSTFLQSTFQGAQGLQGTIGSQGLQGLQGGGTQGIQGTIGSQGLQGLQGGGTQGIQGTIGSQGLQGLQGGGTQGIQGTIGSQGLQGLQGGGTQGLQGLQGTFGPATIPQNTQTAGYTLVASDNGKHIAITTGGVTVPVNVFQVGENVVIYNDSATPQTITQGSNVTLRYAGTTNTGNRTLGAYGVCTVLCVADVNNADVFIISGAGLT
jgi:hypothetical protein